MPGGHGNTAARKCAGVEGAVVDHDLLEIAALDHADTRRVPVNVAGPAALLVAKAHKLGERLDTPHRLVAKDAGDVYRLVEATPLAEMDRLMHVLRADARSADATSLAIDYLQKLFATPRSPGVRLAVAALAVAADEATVTTTITGYVQDLLQSLR